MNMTNRKINKFPLVGKRVLVTGCGYKEVKKIFKDKDSNFETHDSITIDGIEYKVNIGTAAAYKLAMSGATVHIVSKSIDKLQHLSEIITDSLEDDCPGNIEYTAVDLFSNDDTFEFVKTIETNLPLYWVQCVGLGAESFKLENDNPYLKLDYLSEELMRAEYEVTISTHRLLKFLLPKFRMQNETKIVMVTSMSAVRFYPYGGAHCSGKAALDSYAKVSDLELSPDNIFVTRLRPGMVDTGLYDNDEVIKANIEITSWFGLDKTSGDFQLIPPNTVAEMICQSLSAEAHVASVNILARGQEKLEAS